MLHLLYKEVTYQFSQSHAVTGDTRIRSIVTWSPHVTNNVSMFTVKSNQRASKRIKRRARQLAARLARFSNSNQRGYPKQLETAAEKISQCPVKIDYLKKRDDGICKRRQPLPLT